MRSKPLRWGGTREKTVREEETVRVRMVDVWKRTMGRESEVINESVNGGQLLKVLFWHSSDFLSHDVCDVLVSNNKQTSLQVLINVMVY